MVQRYFLDIAYCGTGYHGWQAQPGVCTIQGTIQHQLSLLFARPITITGSSRTDAGVHAKQQFAHVDLPTYAKPDLLGHRLNAMLPSHISINAVRPVIPTAHARFGALSRTYVYHVFQRKNPFHSDLSYFWHGELDMELMNQGADLLRQTQDFESFCKRKARVNNYLCKILSACWQSHRDGYTFHVCANRFLHGMVRAFVGTLLQLGRMKISLKDLRRAIAEKDRCAISGIVPAHGLFLTQVTYPVHLFV